MPMVLAHLYGLYINKEKDCTEIVYHLNLEWFWLCKQFVMLCDLKFSQSVEDFSLLRYDTMSVGI
jgi:hypothetical protein